MGDLLGVSVEELIAILKKKQARLPFEIGAFVALEACEALIAGPAKVTPAEVRVSEDGHVSVYAPPNSATGAEAARSVVGVLAHVLVAAGPGVPPVLLDLVEGGPSDGRWDLGRLRDELEASLVPLNRQAARRVLARMLREARREGEPMRTGQGGHSEPPADVDAELDALIGGGGSSSRPAASAAGGAGAPAGAFSSRTAASPAGAPSAGAASSRPPPVAPARRSSRPGDAIWPDQEPGGAFDEEAPTNERRVAPPPPRRSDVADSISTTMEREAPGGFEDELPTAQARPRRRSPLPEPRARERTPAPEPQPEPRDAPRASEPEPPSRRKPHTPEREKATPIVARDLDLSGIDEVGAKKGRPLLWAVLFLVLIGAVLGTVAYLRPDAVDRFLGNETPEEREAARLEEERAEDQRRLEEEHAGRFGNLVVHASPPESQVLMFVGRGPAVADKLPPGIAHEFIAIADGRAPTRALVPKDAQWEPRDDTRDDTQDDAQDDAQDEGGPRYELAMQTGEEEMTFEELELGDTRLPPDMGEPLPELGSVRIVTNPPGAKVYQLIGFSPTVRVENVRTDEPVELLVWHSGHVPKRHVVGPSDWQQSEGGRQAEVTVELEER